MLLANAIAIIGMQSRRLALVRVQATLKWLAFIFTRRPSGPALGAWACRECPNPANASTKQCLRLMLVIACTEVGVMLVTFGRHSVMLQMQHQVLQSEQV